MDDFSKDKPGMSERWVPVPCSKGTIIGIHGSLVHMSESNKSAHSRHAYTFHMIERSAQYSKDNWFVVYG